MVLHLLHLLTSAPDLTCRGTALPSPAADQGGRHVERLRETMGTTTALIILLLAWQPITAGIAVAVTPGPRGISKPKDWMWLTALFYAGFLIVVGAYALLRVVGQ